VALDFDQQMSATGRYARTRNVRREGRKMTIAGMIGVKGKPIPGTTLFDGDAAQKGYALNAFCYSFNHAENRQAFLDDEAAYLARFDLNEAQKEAVAKRDVLGMIAAGGNIYYLAKLAGVFGLNVQDVGSMQTGLSVAAFKQRLLDQA
jgi:protocatechuate 4,5-dioxygenase, alpha chain